MNGSRFTESVVEEAALDWLESLGYAVLAGPAIAVGEPTAERADPSYGDVLLENRLRQAIVLLNPTLPSEALDDAYRKVTRAYAPSSVERNGLVHRTLVDGVTVEHRRADRSLAGAFVWLAPIGYTNLPGPSIAASRPIISRTKIGYADG